MNNIKTYNTQHAGTYIEFCTHELTFLGLSGQPYRGVLCLQYTTTDKIIELLSLKKYIESLRSKKIIIEDSAAVIHKDINDVLDNSSLCVTIRTTPRGGISSTVVFGEQSHRQVEIKPIVFGN